ncbi:MAG: shikimate kinase [Campylobacter concisus]|nr:shikimate kinase [Campylobacter concisus]
MKTKNNNIVLIGFMGVGKGTTARALSKALKTMNLDCDDLLESSQNMKIKAIFDEFGEEHFRRLEKDLAKFLATNVKNAIIQRLKNSKNSEKKIAKRPLLNDLKKAEALHLEREKLYEKKADYIVEVEGKTPKQIVKEIRILLKV